VLKSVKVLFLNFKRINLPFINKMNRILLLGLLVWICFSGCGKDNTIEEQAAVQLGIDSVIISNYVKSNHLNALPIKDLTTRKYTGEYYIIDTLGTGSALFTSSSLVTVGYKGSILGADTTFINNYGMFHPSFALGTVIMGWQLGLPFIKKGGTIRLLVPSGYAYGPYEQPNYRIPANSILDFTITLYDITN
jgi:FKBP-type peptidyl-prolyl cis-trans isomerase FkpA